MNPLDLRQLQIGIVDAQFRRIRPLSDFTELDLVLRDNARSTGSLTVSTDHPALTDLQRAGAGVVVSWMGETLISGTVLEADADGLPGGLVPFEITDDWSVFDVLAWVRPGSALQASSLSDLAQAWQLGGDLLAGTVQSQSGVYQWPTGTMRAETAAKRLIVENLVQRMGLRVDVEPDRGRGREVAIPEVRFDTVAQALDVILADAGGSLRIFQEPGSETVRVVWREPRTFASPIDPRSGLIAELKYTRSEGATRVVVGGNGSDAARVYDEVRDETGLESRMRWPREIFTTTNDVKLVWPEDLDSDFQVPKYYAQQPGVAQSDKDALRSALRQAGVDALVEAQPTLSITAKLLTNQRFYFGRGGFELGDRMSVVIGGETVQDRIAEVQFKVDANGVDIAPVLGGNSGPERRLAREQQALRRSQRGLNLK